jgi:hypothetical protein
MAYYFAERYEEAIARSAKPLKWMRILGELSLSGMGLRASGRQRIAGSVSGSIGLGQGDPIAVAGLGYAQALAARRTMSGARWSNSQIWLDPVMCQPAKSWPSMLPSMISARLNGGLSEPARSASFNLIYLLVDPRLAPARSAPVPPLGERNWLV